MLNNCSSLFLHTFLFINSISLPFELIECCPPLNLLSLFLFQSFCLLCFFGCCEFWLPWIRLSFHYGKSINVCKTEFTSWKTVYKIDAYIMKNNSIQCTCSYACLRLVLLFSLKQMARHGFTHKISDCYEHLPCFSSVIKLSHTCPG